MPILRSDGVRDRVARRQAGGGGGGRRRLAHPVHRIRHLRYDAVAVTLVCDVRSRQLSDRSHSGDVPQQ